MRQPSMRAEVVTRSRYNRPLDEAGTRFEMWPGTVDRVIGHQRWLWERAIGGRLTPVQDAELAELRILFLSRDSLPAGRTLWLGGTELVKRREASNFNCSFLEVRTVHDVVDAFWLLLQGCGVGFKPVAGALSGFTRKMEVEIIRSTRADRGQETNRESYDPETRTWTIQVGDSAEAWAKSAGKIVAGKFPARKIVFDFSEIRPAGTRLKGYGWISSGDASLTTAYRAICEIMNRKAGKLLSKQDIWDIINWLGTVLSSRRSAQIGLIEYGDPEWRTIATMKPPGFDAPGSPIAHRRQSNNSVVFYEKPSGKQVRDLFEMMVAHGGAEPGFINGREAVRRAPWCKGLNPCGEILLSNYGFCNLCETDLARFRDDQPALHRALYLIARANYRQTVVDLNDGILQSAWHQTNEYLRLCGVGLCGVVRRPDMTHHDYRQARDTAVAGAYSMADELGLEHPKNTTCIKPGGTIPKVMDTSEGACAPVGEYVLNNVIFGRHDPVLPRLVDSNYRVSDHPNDPASVLVTLPVSFEGAGLACSPGGESAIAQLERYRMLMQSWCDQNVSITVSYDPSEVREMVRWFDHHWDSYVGVAFMLRIDAMKSASESGFNYLPQQVVTAYEYYDYISGLLPVDMEDQGDLDAMERLELADCPTGACPVR